MKIAITGGIAEGKSTVLGYCREAGFEVESADDLARQVYARPETQAAIARLMNREPPVPREVVRGALTREPAFRHALNKLTHVEILQAIRKSPARIIEVPLLIEACLQGEFERIWIVTCGAGEQKRRLKERVGAAEAERLLRVQLPTAAKTPFADWIVRTNQPEQTVKANVLEQLKSS